MNKIQKSNLKYALNTCIELLEEWYPDYYNDGTIEEILDIYDDCFE